MDREKYTQVVLVAPSHNRAEKTLPNVNWQLWSTTRASSGWGTRRYATPTTLASPVGIHIRIFHDPHVALCRMGKWRPPEKKYCSTCGSSFTQIWRHFRLQKTIMDRLPVTVTEVIDHSSRCADRIESVCGSESHEEIKGTIGESATSPSETGISFVKRFLTRRIRQAVPNALDSSPSIPITRDRAVALSFAWKWSNLLHSPSSRGKISDFFESEFAREL